MPYRFDWASLATDTLYRELADGVGVPSAEPLENERGREILTRIFRAVGGPSFVGSPWDETEEKAVARQFLREAVRHTLRSFGAAATPASGYRRTDEVHPWIGSLLAGAARLPLNLAAVSELDALPDIGLTLARRIVEERETNGAYLDRTDLGLRVAGLSDTSVNILSSQLVVEPLARTAFHLGSSVNLDDDLRQLVSLFPDPSLSSRLASALTLVAVECATNPHPCVRHGMLRTVPSGDLVTFPATGVGLLLNIEYYQRVPGFFASAQSTVDVCMFHAALPEPNHPTHTLLDALVEAHNRGVQVRVLLDQDRPEDPYGSTLTNTPAKEFLINHGIACRFDTTERLLHSKFFTVDGKLLVLGSHNWSAGSFFGFDDLTLVLESAPLLTALGARFQVLWDNGI